MPGTAAGVCAIPGVFSLRLHSVTGRRAGKTISGAIGGFHRLTLYFLEVMPKISLLCAAYNAERYIREMIASVVSQSFRDFELLIYDDASTDRTAGIARSFDDPRIQVLEGSANRGQNACLHELMGKARGKYAGWIDADDMLDRQTLDYTNWILDQYPQYGLVYTDHFEMNEQSKITGLGRRSQHPYSKDNLLLHFMSFHFRLFRRELYAQIEPLDASLRVASDYELSIKLSEVTDFIHLPLPLYHYRIHPQSLSHQQYVLQSEVCLSLIRQALARRGLNHVQVELYYENKRAKYKFRKEAEEPRA